MKPATDSASRTWTLLSEHSGAFLRLSRLLNGRSSFTLCFLTYSDSVYRDEAARFLEGRLNAHVRVAIDPEERIGTEVLFDRLSADPDSGPAQVMDLESWPDGLDNLLGRLNQRREALAERCPRPLLFWVLQSSSRLPAVATRAADLWAWRSGVFDFTLPPTGIRTDRHQPHIGGPAVFAPERQARIERLQEHSGETPAVRPDRRGPVAGSGRSAEVARQRGGSGNRLLARVENSRKVGRSKTTRHHPHRPNRRHPPGARPTRRSATYPDRRTTACLRETRRRPPAGHHPGQNRRHPPDTRPARRSPATSEPRNNYPSSRNSAMPAHAPSRRAESPTSSGTRTTRRSPANPDRGTTARLRKLGDARSRAITQGQIADILQARGQLDEALRIRTKNNCPSSRNSATFAPSPSPEAKSPTSSGDAGNSTKPCES